MSAFSRFSNTDEDALVALLNLATFFEIESARIHAFTLLPTLPSFRPALQLQLGIRNAIPEWVETGFRALVEKPLDTFTGTDIELLGSHLYVHITMTKYAIEEHRRGLAFIHPDPIHDISCLNELRCELAWKQEWWNGVAKHLLHPDAPATGPTILEELDSCTILDMNDTCKALTASWVRSSGVLTRDESIMEEAVRSLTM